jgi:hypothetical protein
LHPATPPLLTAFPSGELPDGRDRRKPVAARCGQVVTSQSPNALWPSVPPSVADPVADQPRALEVLLLVAADLEQKPPSGPGPPTWPRMGGWGGVGDPLKLAPWLPVSGEALARPRAEIFLARPRLEYVLW